MGKDCNDKIVNISYKIKFIDSFRFMSSSLSILIDNLAVDQLNFNEEIKNIFSYECENCNNKPDYLRFKDNKCYLNVFNVIQGTKNSLNMIFKNTYEFCSKHISKFILLLRKGIFPYEYMECWKRFDETCVINM